jgi:hypothetical protein
MNTSPTNITNTVNTHGINNTITTSTATATTTTTTTTTTKIFFFIFPPLQTAQGTWARNNIDKAQTFANHVVSVFQPNPSNKSPEEEEPIISLLESPYQLEPPPQRFKQSEIQTVIINLLPKLDQATISSPAKFYKKYLLQPSNSLNFLMPLSFSDTSLINGKLPISSSS